MNNTPTIPHCAECGDFFVELNDYGFCVKCAKEFEERSQIKNNRLNKAVIFMVCFWGGKMGWGGWWALK